MLVGSGRRSAPASASGPSGAPAGGGFAAGGLGFTSGTGPDDR
jgi:hypothetical protein